MESKPEDSASRNPYAAPRAPLDPFAPGRHLAGEPARPRPPTFCVVMFSIDLVLCVIRAGIVVLGVASYSMLPAGNPIVQTAIAEFATGAGIALSGIAGNILLLLRVRWAVMLGVLSLVFTLGSLAVGLWQSSIQLAQFPAGSPQYAGFIVGAAIMVIVRLGLMALYGAALIAFSKWANRRVVAPAF